MSEHHATNDEGDCAHWCRACAANMRAGLNPDGTARSAPATTAPELTVDERIAQAIAAERAAIRAEIAHRTPYAANMIELLAWLDARSKGGVS